MAKASLPPLGSFPSEQKRNVEPRKQLEKVTKGAAHVKKERLAEKFAEAFVTKDIDSVKDHILKNVLIPSIKSTVLDAVTDGLSMFLNVDIRRPSSNTYSYSGGSKYDYSKISSGNKSGTNNDRRNDTNDRNTRADYRTIIYPTRDDANEVLSFMQSIAKPDKYGQASVADLYDLSGISVERMDFTDNNYGWTWEMLAHVPINLCRDGWYLDLPKPVPLN